ncbi:MAG: nicotinamide-nucleotide adenylyltransferase [Crenarchaeota archaeon]|nr:nicotinamide-nucleotide adenylyltransferase [Thermoproteota archaeon]
MRGLFIGRFQPFHLGHLKALEWILTQVDEVIIAIGSANVALTFKNPFTVGERIEMITRVMRELELINKIYICSVPDTCGEMHTIWPAYLRHWCPKFDVVFTNDPLSQLCLEYANIEYRSIPFFNREKLSGTHIRTLIAKGDPKWRDLVPPQVASYLEEIGGIERIVKLARMEKVI